MKKRPRHILDGMEDAVGGGETPPFVGGGGGKPASSVCYDYVAFVCLSGCLARSWVCWFACIFASSLYGLLNHLTAGFLAWKGLFEVMGSFG